MDNIERTKRYFDKNTEILHQKKKERHASIVRETRLALEKRLWGKVLDIGSGGCVDYSLEDVESLVSLDISPRQLGQAGKDPKVRCVVGDARNLKMEDGSFDRVVLSHTVHHLAGEDLRRTYENASRCLGQSYRVLKDKGRILIVEAVYPEIIAAIENLFFKFSFFILSKFNKPMVYHFSLSGITGILKKTGFKKISFSYLNTGDALFVPFTLKIGVPFKYIPLRHVLIEAEK